MYGRTRTLLAKSRELNRALEETLATSRQLCRMPPRMIRGGGALENPRGADRLRGEIRRRLHSGTLPLPSREPWAGRGSGELCAICAATILVRDIEYEVPLAGGNVEEPGRLKVHLGCYLVWQEEANVRRAIH